MDAVRSLAAWLQPRKVDFHLHAREGVPGDMERVARVLAGGMPAELIVSSIVVSLSKTAKKFEAWYDMLAAVDKLGHLIDLEIEAEEGERAVASYVPIDPCQPVIAALRIARQCPG